MPYFLWPYVDKPPVNSSVSKVNTISWKYVGICLAQIEYFILGLSLYITKQPTLYYSYAFSYKIL